jgi:hypothetical protein
MKPPMNEREFETYRHDAVHALMDLNEQCENGFRLGEWPRWSIDLPGATLTFVRDGIPRVIADVQLVGSASPDGAVWRWGWANREMPAAIVKRSAELRAFGENEGIADLTKETLPADEHLGWEMTAVAARVLGAKGAYRCPLQSGEVLYLIYTGMAFAPAPEGATVECGIHGRGFPALICEHLAMDPAQSWFSDEPSPANRWPDAWCSVCDAVFLEEGEWNDRTGSRIRVKLMCHRCYEGKRALARQT